MIKKHYDDEREWVYHWNRLVGLLGYVFGIFVGVCLTVSLIY